ncbi:MAG: O-methyltransferase [Chloroflexales bacterium]|nr:O-methyltransferase [Chloroflexales bacterium]
MNKELFSAVDRYVEELFVPIEESLQATLRASEAAGLPTINVAPSQGKLLHILALLCGARRILEVGTLGGYSAIWLGRALPFDGKLITLEYSSAHAEVARANIDRAGLADRVEVRVGRALDLLPQIEAEQVGPFDMIFIDADKQPYTEYFQCALRLSRPGTLIVADNVVRNGAVLDTNSSDAQVLGVQRFNAALSAEPRVAATIVQLVGLKGYDGMAIAVVRS